MRTNTSQPEAKLGSQIRLTKTKKMQKIDDNQDPLGALWFFFNQ